MAITIEVNETDEDKDSTPKVLTGGQKTAAGIKIGTNAGLAAIKALLRNRQAKALQKDLAASRAALQAPVLTDKALAEAKAAEDAVMRQAKAQGARGGGSSGLDADRMKAAQDFALKKTAQRLTARQAGVLGQRKQIADDAKKTSELLTGTRMARDMGLIEDAGKILTDKDTVALLGQAGQRKRKKQTGEFRTGTEEVDKATGVSA